MNQLKTTLETLQHSMAQTVANKITSKCNRLEAKINNTCITLEETFKRTFESFVHKVQGSKSPNRKKTRSSITDMDIDTMQE